VVRDKTRQLSISFLNIAVVFLILKATKLATLDVLRTFEVVFSY